MAINGSGYQEFNYLYGKRKDTGEFYLIAKLDAMTSTAEEIRGLLIAEIRKNPDLVDWKFEHTCHICEGKKVVQLRGEKSAGRCSNCGGTGQQIATHLSMDLS